MPLSEAQLSELRTLAVRGIEKRHPHATPDWWRRRLDLFDQQWPRYLAYLKKWEAAPKPKTGKKAPPLDFYSWQETLRARREAKGGGLGGKLKRAAASPLFGPASIALGGFGAIALGSLGVKEVAGVTAQNLGISIPAAGHGFQATTPEGRLALAQELAAYASVAAPFAGAAIAGGIGTGAALLASAGASAPQPEPPAAPARRGISPLLLAGLALAGGLALLLALGS